jgi:anaerobic selenocysteine-containing dehydrogenase
MSVRISQATAAGASLIVVDPRRTALAGKADVWLRVRPGADGALALGMIHVLLEEGLDDEDFVRDWTNAPFLVREDTGQPVAGPDLAAAADPRSFVVWDRNGGAPAAYRAGGGYDRPAVQPALSGTYRVTGAGGQTLSCRPALELLGELAARYAPERSQALTGVPAALVRQAARLFATQRPSCYYTWAGLEQRRDAVQTNRAISLFYALTGQFDQRGSNVLFASTPTNPVIGRPLLPAGQAARRLGYAERPLGPAGRPGLVRAADVYQAILTGRPYRVRALIAFGTDPPPRARQSAARQAGPLGLGSPGQRRASPGDRTTPAKPGRCDGTTARKRGNPHAGQLCAQNWMPGARRLHCCTHPSREIIGASIRRRGPPFSRHAL